MRLTEDERAALDKHRARRESYSDHDEPTNRYRLQTDEAVTLADMALRLFPVRTYGDIVIRWDAEVTPEKLVACGWHVREGDSSYAIGRDGSGMQYAPTRPSHKQWAIWLMSDGSYEFDSYTLRPRNMGEVWQLMERCGIEEGGK